MNWRAAVSGYGEPFCLAIIADDSQSVALFRAGWRISLTLAVGLCPADSGRVQHTAGIKQSGILAIADGSDPSPDAPVAALQLVAECSTSVAQMSPQ
jgi:hypothetical protein